MKRAQVLQEIRKMQFEQVYPGWKKRRLTQKEAARILGVKDRTFRHYINRYDDEGLEGIYDKRRISKRFFAFSQEITKKIYNPAE